MAGVTTWKFYLGKYRQTKGKDLSHVGFTEAIADGIIPEQFSAMLGLIKNFS